MNPFDPALAEDFLAAFRACDDRAGQRSFTAEWRLLRRAVSSDGCPEIRFAQEITR